MPNIADAICPVNSIRVISSKRLLLFNNPMELKDIRRGAVQKIIDDRFDGNQAAFAEAIKKTAGYVWQITSGHRNLGEKAARSIEQVLNLPVYALDQNQSSSLKAGGAMVMSDDLRTQVEWLLANADQEINTMFKLMVHAMYMKKQEEELKDRRKVG